MLLNNSVGYTRKGYFLPALLLLLFVGLLLRNQGLFPVVFSDEYNYSKFSRLVPLAEAKIPGYLYFSIYRVTNLCGEGFLGCARTLNVFFFLLAAPFIYLTARRVVGKPGASAVTFLSLLGPINTYTAYFMPESFYFFSFWLFTWYILSLSVSSGMRAWTIAGILLGLSALIKPHALFLLPAVAVFGLLVSRAAQQPWVIRAIGKVSLLIISAFFAKLFVGYVVAGKQGLTILGSTYTSIADSTVSDPHHYLVFLQHAAENIRGHVLAVFLLFGLPAAIAISSVFNRFFWEAGELGSDQKVSAYTVLVLASLILVTGLFTASVMNAGPYESLARIHMRYYNFAFPLFLMLAASRLGKTNIGNGSKVSLFVMLPIAGIIIYALSTGMLAYAPSFVDCPELRGITVRRPLFYFVGCFSLLCLFVWVRFPRQGAKLFLYLYMPVVIVLSGYVVNRDLSLRFVDDAYDEAGLFTKRYLPALDLSKVLVVGSDPSGLFRTMFYLDNPGVSNELIPKGSTYDMTRLPTGKEWVLFVGNRPPSADGTYRLDLNGFSLIRAFGSKDTDVVDFRNRAWPGVVFDSTGLSSAESWGTWSLGKEVVIEFTMPLPERFRLRLVANAFGPNAGKDIIVLVGADEQRFQLGQDFEEHTLEFSNKQRSKIVKFVVPQPVSPADIGFNSDRRLLGIGFVQLSVEPMATASVE